MNKLDTPMAIILIILLPILGFIIGKEHEIASQCMKIKDHQYSYDLGLCVVVK